jgi:hypothetical protein
MIVICLFLGMFTILWKLWSLTEESGSHRQTLLGQRHNISVVVGYICGCWLRETSFTKKIKTRNLKTQTRLI